MNSGGCRAPYIVDDVGIFINIGCLNTDCAQLPPDLVIECVAFFI